MTVAVVTDSTACLPRESVTRHGIHVVPLHVVVEGRSFTEGEGISCSEVAEALRAHRTVSTSKPSPGEMLDAYEKAAAGGVDAIVSVHLSASMSATVSSALVAASESPVPVTVVDSHSVGMAMGFAVESAARYAAAGASAEVVARAARSRAEAARAMFYVDTLEYLRRGGRIGKASALLGSALAIKPLLELSDGQILPLERVRTSSKALVRLEDRLISAVEAMDAPLGVEIAIHHLDSRPRADDLLRKVRARLPHVRSVQVVELGAVVGTHVGPGTLAVAASPWSGPSTVIGAAVL
ncbi:DegV family protein [Luteipulveratus sp. YIM 133132]|uniref:DegV family protein n=1 Tax=Luteipulveratus flavus TaxID=3031728 RepID=UPI0023AEEED6|nr:DegV family protein [Luteipulveratus sp. YIM 133132]MDE9366163.1 DegV family protein [Luteipulveratus sp. YIM 133132]